MKAGIPDFERGQPLLQPTRWDPQAPLHPEEEYPNELLHMSISNHDDVNAARFLKTAVLWPIFHVNVSSSYENDSKADRSMSVCRRFQNKALNGRPICSYRKGSIK
jgi:hypothetical protein